MQKVPVSLWTLVAGIVVTVISIWFGQNHNLLPVQASEQAAVVDRFFNVMFTIAIALFLVVEGTILIFLFKYRRRQGDNTDGVPLEGNVPLEIFWTAIPAMIVIALGIYSVDVYNQIGGFEPGSHFHSAPHVNHVSGTALAATLDDTLTPVATPNIGIGGSPHLENQPADLVVDVQGMQYAWIFNYPNSGITTGELHIPVGADVQLNLSALDVIHSFWVPQFRLKQDAIPGMATELRFVPTKPGTYPVICTELCGGYHGSMRTEVIVHTPEDFDSWLAQSQIAQKQDLNSLVAVNPTDLSTSEFLAPYVHDLGINAATLLQLPKQSK
ncbi:cytochrome c oxidase subunit II [Umezakia ovalisporum]|jgi:cytochrome c oxidase subunit 2|uniref:Cytochrome c oxidase subunit 2 n=2 Tax=Umezakia ovalisporum TaxID=75695 RepID=A0AA43GY25_9CYAN|nr:cytochrome c oxidase subunit II [Umezakia ovalisporum]MBI1241594.1 cytochrome C oxidase subunit II [Nostoc sp. RI_552]MDH6057665.1 cytochrome c oxidase subunit II [Umezakia ovalisporum FSS-43]MDH6063548.1 cytochrome c oxidase subunit II [Umezakia ovalisporum FSS-62]MDH6066005.1 cytochrome c oxidase subunit II [Umezakia ovalisporum APH033B]MDH6072473.1 cytochrome c oxidase subunit II [Umezakia ovalisporum CobakiLakeA]